MMASTANDDDMGAGNEGSPATAATTATATVAASEALLLRGGTRRDDTIMASDDDGGAGNEVVVITNNRDRPLTMTTDDGGGDCDGGHYRQSHQPLSSSPPSMSAPAAGAAAGAWTKKRPAADLSSAAKAVDDDDREGHAFGKSEAAGVLTSQRGAGPVTTHGGNRGDGGGSDTGGTRQHREGCMLHPSPSPIKLFATAQDEELRLRLHLAADLQIVTAADDAQPQPQPHRSQRQQQQQQQQHWSFQHCWTLREMLGLDRMWGPLNGAGMDFVVLATYILDVDFLMAELPELVDVPVVVVVYQHKDPSLDEVSERAWRDREAAGSLVLLELDPRADPKSGTNPLSVRMDYGCHHSKFVLVGYRSGRLRVVVHTSNMRREDVHLKCQGAYIQDFLPKTEDQLDSFATSDFEEALVQYLESYRYLGKHSWTSAGGPASAEATTLVAHLQTYDFSTAVGVLIPSVPGYHSTSWQKRHDANGSHHQAPVLGYLKVQQAIAEHTTSTRGGSRNGGSSSLMDVGSNDCPQHGTPTTIVCQFSSMGSLSKPYLDKLAAAWSVDAVHGRKASAGATATATAGGVLATNPYQRRTKRPKAVTTTQPAPTHRDLTIVWPTVEEIVDSVEGGRGGASVPGRATCVGRDFLLPLYHRWSAACRPADGGPGHQQKGRNVPHIKTYYEARNDDDDGDGDSMRWFVLTSHNLSKAAWGEIQNRQDRGEVLTIQHWELGVFISPETLEVDSMGPPPPGHGGAAASPDEAHRTDGGKRRATIPLPYKFRPDPYGPSDQPWVVDLLG